MLYSITDSLAARQNVTFNEEQRKFIEAPPVSILSESLPGTGKTFTLYNRIAYLIRSYGIPSDKIFASSFTNMATLELKYKFEELCKLLNMRSNVHFDTISSLCSQLLRANKNLIGIEDYHPAEVTMETTKNACEFLCDVAKNDFSDDLTNKQARNIFDAINVLNSSLIFCKEHIVKKKEFIKLKINYDKFNYMRKQLYEYYRYMGNIPLSSIPLYTLELLENHPQICNDFKSKYKVLIVDEFQDLSLLQLRIIYLLTNHCIAIGDINQQIYAFQGACSEIVDKFYEYFPDAINITLKQSYRCSSKIADYAKAIIAPNNFKSSSLFKGIDKPESQLIVHNSKIDLNKILSQISYEYNTVNIIPKSHMFLFRNNRSANLLVDKCFDYKIPVRVNNYKSLCSVNQPIMKTILPMIQLILNPKQTSRLLALVPFFPEFRGIKNVQNFPLYKIMKDKDLAFYDIKFMWLDGGTTISKFLEVKDLIEEGKPFIEAFNILYPILYTTSLSKVEHYYPYSLDSVVKTIKDIAKDLTYQQLISREYEKEAYVKKYTEKRLGVRCYTFHAAKGLEADCVYIIDADEGVIPSSKEIEVMTKLNAHYDVAIDVRNERSLCFVAATRAKTDLHIFYNIQLSSIFRLENEYVAFDDYYYKYRPKYTDVEVFKEFTNADYSN